MDQLVEELTVRGELDGAALDWARSHQAVHGGTVPAALLELDLIDEDSLLRSLEACFDLPAAGPIDVAEADPVVGKRVPKSLSEALDMCPVRIADDKLVALVEHPLSPRWVEELRFAGLGLQQLVCPAHYIDLARSTVYGTPCPDRARELEQRLERRRRAPDLASIVARVERASTLAAATVTALDYAASLVSFSCFLVSNGHLVRVGAVSGGEPVPKEQFPVPDKGSTFGAAIQYGGYYVGPVAGTQADHDFYRALGRPLPRYAFLAPVPMTNSLAVAFYADNGSRGLAARWIAELTLLAARLGQHAKTLADRGRRRVKRPEPAAATGPQETLRYEEKAPPTARSTPPPLTRAEQRAVDRLRRVAAEEGTVLETLVDELLLGRDGAVAPEPNAAALMAEVRGLFSKLATEIPGQLAEGMESAFRDLAPRLSPPPGKVEPGPPSSPSPPRTEPFPSGSGTPRDD